MKGQTLDEQTETALRRLMELDIQWRGFQLGRQLNGDWYLERTGGGPRLPVVFFDLCVGRLRVRYGG